MFVNLQTPVEIFLLIVGLAVFSFVAWRRLDWGAALVLFCAPLYLLKIKVGWLPLSVLEVLIWVFFGIFLVKRICQRKNPPHPPFFKGGRRGDFWFFPILLILAGAALSTIFSADLRVSAGIFKSWILEPIVFGFLLIDVIQTKKHLEKALLALVLSGTAVAVIGLGYIWAGQLTFDGRLKAFYLSPNHLAMFLAPAFLITIGFLLSLGFVQPTASSRHPEFISGSLSARCRNKFGMTNRASCFGWGVSISSKIFWRKLLFVVCGLVLAVVLYYTFSYAAWSAILVALIFFVFCLFRAELISSKKLFFVFCLVFIVVLILFSLQFSSEKLNNLLNSERSSWQSRLAVWQAALKIGQDHWFLGIGPGLFQKYYLIYQKYFPVPYLEWAAPQPHNLFLAWWLQAGILGLAGFGWLLINFFRWTVDAMKKTKQPLVMILMAVMVYVLIHGLLDTTYWKNDLALIFWAVIALSYVASQGFTALGYRASRRPD